jgi:hypothetical protein
MTFEVIEQISGGTTIFAEVDVNSNLSRSDEPVVRSVDTDNSTGGG